MSLLKASLFDGDDATAQRVDRGVWRVVRGRLQPILTSDEERKGRGDD